VNCNSVNASFQYSNNSMPKFPILFFLSLKSGGIRLSKEGCVFLEFAPAVGPRQYDWSKKQVSSPCP
jgi:hypothetical protein